MMALDDEGPRSESFPDIGGVWAAVRNRGVGRFSSSIWCSVDAGLGRLSADGEPDIA